MHTSFRVKEFCTFLIIARAMIPEHYTYSSGSFEDGEFL